MRTHKHLALAAILLSILLLPGSALAESSTQCPAPGPSDRALAWELEAPSLGISWRGSLALEAEMPVAERRAAPAADREEEPPGLVDAARRAVKLVQAVLQSYASLLALASRTLS